MIMESTEIFTQYRPAATDAELLQILELQQANLYDRIPPEIRAREGFLKIQHNLPLLQKMQAQGPQIIALCGGDLAGYALNMHPSQEGDIPALRPLFDLARKSLPPGADFRIMGQICVSSAYRRQGHFRKLYEALFEMCRPLPVVTEIASVNTRSLEAHKAIGFRPLGSRQESDLRWEVMIWP
jgi:GNAT superfamily N-acetyltransferase